MNKIFTIVIPTFNRKERLLRQIDSIYALGNIETYYMVIVDNASNYNIKDALLSRNYNMEFLDNIEIHRNKVNTRMGYNLASLFLFTKTKWVVFMSDDDLSTPNCITSILHYIEKYPNATLIKFQLGTYFDFQDSIVTNVDEFLKTYQFLKLRPGDLFYLGNNIINTDSLGDYIGDAFEFSSYLIPHIMPSMHQLVDEKATIVFSKEHIQKYVINTYGDSVMSILTLLKFAEMCDIGWGNHKKTHKLFRLIGSHFVPLETASSLLAEKDKTFQRYAYKRLRNSILYNPLSISSHFIWFYYNIENILGIPIITKYIPFIIQKKSQFKDYLKTTRIGRELYKMIKGNYPKYR